jgi:membrane associated rhomboid family serine protease
MPPVVKNLLIINVIVFFAMYGLSLGVQYTPLGVWLMEWMALWPAGVPAPIVEFLRPRAMANTFYPWQVITSSFMHGGMGHLFFNMFALWIFGMRIENVWGSKRFLFFYFWCVVGASLIQLLVVSFPYIIGDPPFPRPFPTLGASGGVLGVLLAFGMMYPNEPIYLYFFVPIKAKYLVIGFAVLSIVAGATGTAAGIAHFAHLGGMLAGFVLIQYWRGKPPFKRRPREKQHWREY